MLASIADLSLRSLFFSELENPEWLEPLAALGVFVSPPEPQVDSEGIERVLPWPEGDYLVRIANDRPDDVVTILQAVAESRNPWVQRTVISAAMKLPSNRAKHLARPIAKIVASASGWLNVEDVFAIAAAYSEAGEVDSVKLLVNTLFEPKAGPEEPMAFGTRIRVDSAIDDYFYTELLPRSVPLLTQFDDLDGLKMVAGWLQQAARIQDGSRPDRPDYDASTVWRASIAPHGQNAGLHELSDSLIDAVRDTAFDLGRLGEQTKVVEFLNGARPFVMRRIGVEVAAQLVGEQAPAELLPLCESLLVDPALMGIGSRPEYVHLALAALPRLTPEQRNAWATFVMDGSWQGTDEDMRRITAWGDRSADDVTEDEVAETRQHLLHRFLQPLKDALPSPLAAELVRLEAQHGAIEHAEFGSYMESFTGPNSPKPRDELAAMSPEELATFLRTWQPAGDHHFGPSVDGLARVLEEVAESDPELVAAFADQLTTLGRSYVRAALAGWAKAIPNGYLPSPAVWDMVRDVVGQGDDGSDDLTQRDYDADDPVWRWAQRNVVDLISTSLDAAPRPVPRNTIAQLWTLLKPLTNHADPTPEHEARYGGDNMDPLMLSLNTTRPAALRAAIRLAAASHDSPEPGNPDATEADILQAVASHVDVFADPSLAVAAVVGEGIGKMWGIDPGWVDSRASELFSVLDSDDARRARADVIVSVALRVYQPGRVFIELIRPALAQILSTDYKLLTHTAGWRERRTTVNAAAQHIVAAYLLQVVQQDDPQLQQLFLDGADDDIRAEALGHIGWQIMRTAMDDAASTIPQEYLDRAQGLIEWRANEIRAGRASARELAQFHWWAQSGVFSPAWWLPIVLLASDSADRKSTRMMGKPLADAAAEEPAFAIEAFEKLYGSVERDWRSYDLIQNAPRLLAEASRSGNAEAIAGADRIKDVLGRHGHFQALQELEQLLAADTSDEN
ncbi:MAG: hypothetical protein ACR2LX_05520 [Jatrophihabitans sp.]